MGADGASVEDQLAALFVAAPEGFVASRDELVRRLRAAGDAATARQVKALRRPTVSASIVNGLARAEPELLRQLADVGETLRAAEASLDGAALRQISGQRRALVDGLVRTAVSLAEAAGTTVGADTRGEVQATLDAALAAPDLAAVVASGRLERPLSTVGFGLDVGSLGSPGSVSSEASPVQPPGSRAGRKPAETAAERRWKAAAEALAAAEESAGAADAAAGVAAEELAAAESERAELRTTLEELRERVADAERRLAEATLDVRSRTAARDRADRTAERARAELARRREAVAGGGA